VAASTLANSPNPHQLFTRIVRPFAPLTYAKSHPEFQGVSHGRGEISLADRCFRRWPNHLPPQDPDFRAQKVHPVEQTAQRRSQK